MNPQSGDGEHGRAVRERATILGYDLVETERADHAIELARTAVAGGADEVVAVGGSDAHFPNEVGRAFTTVDVDRVTPETVVGAIRDGRTDFRVVERTQDRYLRRLYGVIHRLKGHTNRAGDTASVRE